MTPPDNHRHCLLIRGNRHEILSQFLHVTQHLADPFICSQDPKLYQSIRHDIETCTFKQVKQQLGRTHEAVLIDLSQGVSASALAILAGTIRGGGVFALALPDDDWQHHTDEDLRRYLPWPYEPEQVHSYFKDYLLARLTNAQSPFKSYLAPFPSLPTLTNSIHLTSAQQAAQQTLLQQAAKHYVLCAPRGRGKSTLLGDSLAILCQRHHKVALVAANQEAIGTLKKQFLARSQQDGLRMELPFYAPDAFLADSQQWDLLMVDEAAMLPVPQLIELSKRATTTLFSTTDYGYEGAGRGFSLRFNQYLQQQQASAKTQVIQLELDEPIRWGKNDPLETWINDSFFFGPSWTQENQQQVKANTLAYRQHQAKDWLTTPKPLAQAFQLLTNAHYQTAADNLRWMLDDPTLHLHGLYEEDELQAIAIVSEEGQLDEPLSQQVMLGKRRPRGHLLPQSLLAHEAIAEAGQFQYWRISRIATQPALHNQGIGSRLLQQMAEQAQDACDFLATSFAVSPEVLSFWLKNGYQIVRLGTAKDQASGAYSIMMLNAMSPTAQSACIAWRKRFLDKFCISLLLQYEDVSCELLLAILNSHKKLSHLPLSLQLTSSEANELGLFIHHHKPLDSLRPALYKACLQLAIQDHLQSNSPLHQVFLASALGRPTQALQKKAKLSGKKDLLSHLKQHLKEKQDNLIKIGE